ncbi:MAG TPA: hypothetical protein VHB77_12460 [Planctomycetaceae bacterium]|jgi:hypothetical protein|nr:hypothetical protein [Planctomycetaceae bacterium]
MQLLKTQNVPHAEHTWPCGEELDAWLAQGIALVGTAAQSALIQLVGPQDPE